MLTAPRCCSVLCCNLVVLCSWWLQVSPDNGWVPIWRAPMLAVVVLVCSLFALLLGAILVSNRLQSWLKVSSWGSVQLVVDGTTGG